MTCLHFRPVRRPTPLVMLATAVLLGACSSGGDEGLTPVPTTASPSAIAFAVTGLTVESVALPPPPFPDDVKASVLATLDRYLQDAVLGPLRSGQPAGDLGPVFTGRARPRVDGPDRAALVDEGLGPVPADSLRAEVATLGLSALVGGDGITVVTAAVDLRLRTTGDDPTAIARTGHLVLVPEGDGWKIDGYDVRTTRDGGGAATATTARR